MAIKAVIFDVGGVLFITRRKPLRLQRHDTESVNVFLAKKLGVDIDTWFDSISDVHTLSTVGGISKRKALSTIAKNIHRTPEQVERAYIAAYRRYFRQNMSLYRVVDQLKGSGYLLGVLSDQWSVGKEAMIQNHLMKPFDSVVISCDVGMRKPNPRIYRRSLRELGVKPHEAVFIDNRDWNTDAAAKLGMKIVLFKNNRQTIRDLRKLGVRV